MRTKQSGLLGSITYLNVILTIIAILSAIRVAHDFGLLRVGQAHAANVMPVQIEAVRGTIPVAIKEPVSSYLGAVCVSPCK